MKTELFIEVNGKKTLHTDIIDAARQIWKDGGNKVKDLKSIALYFKPEEGRCYYIFNDDASGSFEV